MQRLPAWRARGPAPRTRIPSSATAGPRLVRRPGHRSSPRGGRRTPRASTRRSAAAPGPAMCSVSSSASDGETSSPPPSSPPPSWRTPWSPARRCGQRGGEAVERVGLDREREIAQPLPRRTVAISRHGSRVGTTSERSQAAAGQLVELRSRDRTPAPGRKPARSAARPSTVAAPRSSARVWEAITEGGRGRCPPGRPGGRTASAKTPSSSA